MSFTAESTVTRSELADLARAALAASGASSATTEALVDATLFAEDRGLRGVGSAHLLDFLRALDDGRIDGGAAPTLTRPATAVLACDAHSAPFHTGFTLALDEFVALTRAQGVAVFVQSGAFAGGQLGWFTEQLSSRGLASIAVINSNALLATEPGVGRVLGTNPMSFSFPRTADRVLTVDQSSSATAFVNVREAAARGEPIPEGWAVDSDGVPTTDPGAAVDGAMLPFGSYKGANIAWMIELLAGLSGANWSIDAPAFDSGDRSPGVGMFVLAIDVAAFPGDFVARADAHVERLASLGARTPGTARAPHAAEFSISTDVLDELRSRAER